MELTGCDPAQPILVGINIDVADTASTLNMLVIPINRNRKLCGNNLITRQLMELWESNITSKFDGEYIFKKVLSPVWFC